MAGCWSVANLTRGNITASSAFLLDSDCGFSGGFRCFVSRTKIALVGCFRRQPIRFLYGQF